MTPRYDPRDATSGTKVRPCQHCGRRGHEHDRVRVTPDDGPVGSYHYELHCPDPSALVHRPLRKARKRGQSP